MKLYNDPGDLDLSLSEISIDNLIFNFQSIFHYFMLSQSLAIFCQNPGKRPDNKSKMKEHYRVRFIRLSLICPFCVGQFAYSRVCNLFGMRHMRTV